VEDIVVHAVDPALLSSLEPLVDRHTTLALLRTDERLYVTVGERTLEGPLTRCSLVA
jgi:hypothetical protein